MNKKRNLIISICAIVVIGVIMTIITVRMTLMSARELNNEPVTQEFTVLPETPASAEAQPEPEVLNDASVSGNEAVFENKEYKLSVYSGCGGNADDAVFLLGLLNDYFPELMSSFYDKHNGSIVVSPDGANDVVYNSEGDAQIDLRSCDDLINGLGLFTYDMVQFGLDESTWPDFASYTTEFFGVGSDERLAFSYAFREAIIGDEGSWLDEEIGKCIWELAQNFEYYYKKSNTFCDDLYGYHQNPSYGKIDEYNELIETSTLSELVFDEKLSDYENITNNLDKLWYCEIGSGDKTYPLYSTCKLPDSFLVDLSENISNIPDFLLDYFFNEVDGRLVVIEDINAVCKNMAIKNPDGACIAGRCVYIEYNVDDYSAPSFVLYHEFGHVLKRNIYNLVDWENVYESTLDKASFKINDYYLDSEEEFFAECFALYIIKPEKLKLVAPDVYNRIEYAIDNFEHLNEMLFDSLDNCSDDYWKNWKDFID